MTSTPTNSYTTSFSTLTSAFTWPFTRSTPPSAPPSPPPSGKSTPRRLPSPMNALTPLSLAGYAPTTHTHLLPLSLAEELRLLLPARLQLHSTWTLSYSLEQHGASLTTLFSRTGERKHAYILIVKSHLGEIFGAFVNEGFRPIGRYYGTGECFLWRQTGRAFRAYPYSGENEYAVLCEQSFLSVGGGEGRYGLWLDDSLEKGVSERCTTFGNEPLSEAQRGRFEVVDVEVWRIGGGEVR